MPEWHGRAEPAHGTARSALGGRLDATQRPLSSPEDLAGQSVPPRSTDPEVKAGADSYLHPYFNVAGDSAKRYLPN